MSSARKLTKLVYDELADMRPWEDFAGTRWWKFEPGIELAAAFDLPQEDWKVVRQLYAKCAKAALKVWSRYREQIDKLPFEAEEMRSELADCREREVWDAVKSYQIMDC